MATKRLPRPRDPMSLAKLIGDIATGQAVDAVKTPSSSSGRKMRSARKKGSRANPSNEKASAET
jgi:hypothetical protein